MKNKKGITLIALVVTIIVLLILAGVTLALVSGENGILKRATNSVEVNEKATAEEEANLLIAELVTQYYEEKYVNHKAELGSADEYIENQLTAGKKTQGGYSVKYNEKTGKIEILKEEQLISSGAIANGKVEWSKENTGGDDVEDGSGGNDQSYEDYIDEKIPVDQKIYINSQTGNDETGEGTEKNPYATLDKIAESGIIENGYRYAIFLMDGEYELTEKIFTLNCNREINIIGNKEKTILKVGGLFANSAGGNLNYSVKIYRLVWSGNYPGPNSIYIYNEVSWFNIVFEMSFDVADYGYFISDVSNGYHMYNCTLPKVVPYFLRNMNNRFWLTNCYGGFSSGYGTVDAGWDYQTNYITQTPQVDENYRITEEESVWKNVGTGTNPDGTQANLGVYGGEFSWDK